MYINCCIKTDSNKHDQKLLLKGCFKNNLFSKRGFIELPSNK